MELDDFLRSIHWADFSFIRVEADKATWDLHIPLRFELERWLLNGDLQMGGIPAAWNAGRFRLGSWLRRGPLIEPFPEFDVAHLAGAALQPLEIDLVSSGHVDALVAHDLFFPVDGDKERSISLFQGNRVPFIQGERDTLQRLWCHHLFDSQRASGLAEAQGVDVVADVDERKPLLAGLFSQWQREAQSRGEGSPR